jgi:hypothetical protein
VETPGANAAGYFDFHIGGDSLSVASDWAYMNIARDYLATHGSQIRAVVLEENGGLHDVQRALGHARRSNRLHCLGDWMRADTPANGLQVCSCCTERLSD